MRWFSATALWLLAGAISLAVLWRLFRGHKVLLRGRYSPQLVRRIAILLVILGAGAEKTSALAAEGEAAPKPSTQPQAEEEELPRSLTVAVVGQWLSHQQPASAWSSLKQELIRRESLGPGPQAPDPAAARSYADAMPDKFRILFRAHLDAMDARKPLPASTSAELLGILDEMENAGYYDHWLGAYLWRRTESIPQGTSAPAKEKEELFARLHRHARVTNTLLRAQARIKPFLLRPRPWMSKAGPSLWERQQMVAQQTSTAEVRGAARVLYPQSDAGTWERDGIARLSIGKDSAPLTLLRGGTRQVISAGQELRFGRLDLLQTPPGSAPVELTSAWPGKLTIPPSSTLSTWDLPKYLAPEARARLTQHLAEAMSGSEDAANQLERHLPLVHQLLRTELRQKPTAKGAPRLRLILSLFDDATMPLLVPGVPPANPEEPLDR